MGEASSTANKVTGAAALGASTTSASQQPDPLIGRVINGRFTIQSVIARGGMGKVYRAEQSPLGRVVALKVLHPNYSGENDPEFHKRFFLEASIVAKLTHPNTVTLYDYGQTDDNVYFMAMECLEGRTLHRLIRTEGALDTQRALHILVQAARALREAHGHGVIHRDLKPANVFLIKHDDDPDFVKLLDFGLLKRTDESPDEALTQTGLFMGSPKYMAPEQIRGERVSSATDVYALGVMLFEMLTGRVPFDKPNSVNLLMAHVTDPIPTLASVNPSVMVPSSVEDMVYRCLAKDPAERFASMDELIAAIRAAGAAMGRPLNSLTGEFAGQGGFATSAPHALGGSGETASPTRPPPLPSSPPSGSSPSATSGVRASSDRPMAPETVLEASLPSQSLPRPESFANSQASALAAPPAAPTGARLRWVWAALLLGAGVCGAFLALRGRGPAVASVAVPSAPTPTVNVALESEPSGAEIFEGDTRLGTTPFRATWQGAQGDPNRTRTFRFTLAGHQPLEVSLSGASMLYLARLRPMTVDASAPVVAAPPTAPPVAAPLRPVRPARPVRPPRGATAPNGYRVDVY
ncbi:MAG: serine/threonine protein kinase [Myxococcales bacterium]|nr:serine/threonine protein kinase [Myxococcales bacterium]